MITASEDPLREFYQNLSEGPLEPDHPWYVPLYLGPSGADPVQGLARRIEWEPLESAQLFSGLHGTGKSTELRRLRRLLEERGFKVVLCDMKDYLNLAMPIDISDFLMSIAEAVSDALADPGLLGHWRRAAGFGQAPQQRVKGHLAALTEDVRTVLADCVKALRNKHGEDTRVVILVDSIEQLRGTWTSQAQVFASVESLFFAHADKLRFPGMHVVYTVPPWLELRSPGLAGLYDGAYSLACVEVREHGGQPHAPGLERLRKLLAQRGDWRSVVAQAELDHVLSQTGGCLRDLLCVVQGMLMNAADREGRALEREAVDFELAKLRNDYLPVAMQDARWLLGLAGHEAEGLTRAAFLDLPRLVDRQLLLRYGGAEARYELHPLIRKSVERLAARAALQADELHGCAGGG